MQSKVKGSGDAIVEDLLTRYDSNDVMSEALLPSSGSFVKGVILDFHDGTVPFVTFPGHPGQKGVRADTTIPLSESDIGRRVALLFENGNRDQPLIIGRIRERNDERAPKASKEVNVLIDGERLVFDSKHEIVIRCGDASITLTKAGKILIRGTYVLARSSGVNRIVGGSVKIN